MCAWREIVDVSGSDWMKSAMQAGASPTRARGGIEAIREGRMVMSGEMKGVGFSPLNEERGTAKESQQKGEMELEKEQ